MWQPLLNITPRPAYNGRSVAPPLSHPRVLPCALSFLPLPRNRHNKNNTSVGRSRKTRGATPSAADPLRVFGKTIEIADPARDGAIVLQGKVSWFDPVRSRYCVIEYVHGRSEGDGGSSRRGGSGGGGDAKGWAHWIAVDKLVEAKAIGLEKNGTRFALESLVSLEEEEDGGVVDQTESETNTTESDVQDNVRVKIEEQEEDGVKEGEEGSITSSSVEEGANSKEDAEQVNRSGEQKGRREIVRLEEKQASDKDEAHVRMRGTTMPPAAQEPDPLPQREPGEEVEQTDSQWPPARDSPREESNGGFSLGQNSVPGGSEDGDTATTSIENTKSEPVTRRATQHHQNADVLLPSVQCPETSDSFARYPTRRGRRRCSPSPAVDNNSSIIREGASSLTKRPRLESKDIGGPAGGRATGWKPTTAPPSPAGGGTVGGGDAPSAVAVYTSVGVNKGTSSPRQSPQEAVCRELGAGSKVSGALSVEPIAEQASDSAYSLEAGWPCGMEMLGQVPVMRVRSVPVSDGNEASFKATYFASAYAGATAEISASDKQSARSRFSFRFEELEELNASHLQGALQNDSRFAESFFQAPRQGSPGQLGGTRKRERAEEDARHDAKGGAYIDRNIRDSERSGAQDEQEEGGGIEPEGRRTEDAILVRDTMPPSPRSSEEFSDSMEDGEMKMLPDGRADIMPPSPPDGDMEKDPVGLGNGDQVTEDPDHRSEGALNEDDGQENAADAAEDMEISSDEQSFGSPEGAETASSCCSDEEVMCDIGADLALCNAAAAAAATLGTAAAPDASLRPANGGAIATPFPAAPEDSLFRQQQASAGDWDNSQCLSASAASQLVSAGAVQDEVAMQGQVVSSEPQPSVSVAVGERPEVLALRRIVREQLQDILRSASKGREAALSSGDGNAVLEKIAADVEEELFGRLYKDSSGGRAYKVCFMGAFVCCS